VHVAPHEDFARIAAGLEACLGRSTPWEGTVYRSAAPRYSGDGDIATGAGSFRMGGRWNPPGRCRTVYASLDPETAMKEALATFRYYGWALHDAMPRIFRALEIRLERVINLRHRRVREHLAPWLQAALDEDWRSIQSSGQEPTSQAIGRAAFELRLEGLLVPSHARRARTNLIVFPDNLLPGRVLRTAR
jgi:RES domain-containing protein